MAPESTPAWQPPDAPLPEVTRDRSLRTFFAWVLLTAWPLLMTKDGVLAGVYGCALLLRLVAPVLFGRDRVSLDTEGSRGASDARVLYRDITSLRLEEFAVVSRENAAESPFLLVGHARGAFRIPQARNLDLHELYRYLLPRSRLVATPTSLPERLERVRAAEVAEFGPERVLATRGRTLDAGDRPTHLPVLGILAGVMLACFAAELRGRPASDLLAFLGISACALLAWLASLPVLLWSSDLFGKPDRDLGLVVSPRSITLEDPTRGGTILWSEVTDLRDLDWSGFAFRGLLLRVRGSAVHVHDAYELPLTEIATFMRRCHDAGRPYGLAPLGEPSREP